MATTPFSYTEAALANSQPLRTSVPAAVEIPVAPVSNAYSDAAIDNLRAQFGALPEAQQGQLVQAMTAQGINGTQQVAAFLNTQLNSDVAMTAAPMDFDQRQEAGLLAMSNSNGYSSLNAVDFERTQAMVDAAIAPYLGDPEKVREIASKLPIPPEHVQAVQARVEHQIESNRNPLEGMLAALEPATIETAAVNNQPLQAALVANRAGRNLLEEEMQRARSWITNPGMMPSTPSFAAVETVSVAISSGNELLGDLAPTSGLPNFKAGPGRGGPDFA